MKKTAEESEELPPTSLSRQGEVSLISENTTDSTPPLETPLKTPLKTVVLLVTVSLIALAASAELVLSELKTLKDPSAALGCDINPLIGCSSSLLQWQAHLLFGIPNALVGTALFAGLAGVFLGWVGGRLPRWLPLTIEAGLTAALFLIIFFLHQSVTVFRTLCPFCMIVWVATIVLWIHLGALLARLGWLDFLPAGLRGFWVSQRWLLTVAVLLLIVLVIALTMSDKLAYLF